MPILTVIAILMTLSAAIVAIGGNNRAEAATTVLTLEDHWKYVVTWHWDPGTFRSTGLINPKIIVANETSDKITGYIADANGTRLTMYNDEHYVMVRYTQDDGFVSKWSMAGKTHDGWFTIDIPEEFRNAQTVGIYISNHMYSVASNDLTVAPPRIFINSARLDYRTNSTLVEIEPPKTTEIAQQQSCLNPSTSLIDYILSTIQESRGSTVTTCRMLGS